MFVLMDGMLSWTNQRGQIYSSIADLVLGKLLDKKCLIERPKEGRMRFYARLIDILAELRPLEIP